MLRDLFCDPNDRLSASKIWTHIAFGIGSYVVVKLANVDSPYITEVFLWYLVIVSGSELGKKFMTMKLSNKENKE